MNILENQKSNAEEVFETLTKYGLNWSVNKKELETTEGGRSIPYFGLMRSDSNDCFGVVTDRYEPYQNSELAELAHEIQDKTGFKIDNGEAHGSRVSISLEQPDLLLEYPTRGDVLGSRVMITNPHGDGALKFALDTKVLSCENGWTRWMNQRQTSVRHTKNMRSMIGAALKSLEVISEERKTFEEKINEMIGVKVDGSDIGKMVEKVVNVDIKKTTYNEATKAFESIAQKGEDAIHGKTLNALNDLVKSIESEMEYKGANVWGLFNGVTHWTTHKYGNYDAATRRERKAFGSLNKKDSNAWETAKAILVEKA